MCSLAEFQADPLGEIIALPRSPSCTDEREGEEKEGNWTEEMGGECKIMGWRRRGGREVKWSPSFTTWLRDWLHWALY